jgi:hypothetical protein
MTTTPLWPAPPPRRGGRIRHRVLCPRQAPIVETVRTTADGHSIVVEMCSECEATDLAERLHERGNGPEAA